MKSQSFQTPHLFKNYGIGVGLRPAFYPDFVDVAVPPRSVKWLEVISENFMKGKVHPNSRPIKLLEKVRKNYDVALHGVSLNIGSAEDLDLDYLKELKTLIDIIDPIAVSDHLCWTKVHGVQTHELNPLPYTESLIGHVVEKIKKVQDFLGRRILIENVSSYLTFESSVMSEEEFIREVSERSDSGILLDLNNVFVSSRNHGFDSKEFLRALPRHRVGQIHVAGHSVEENGFLIDTHDHPVRDEVWDLYRWYGAEFGHPSSMLERDGNIPAWGELEKEVLKLESLFHEKEAVPMMPAGPIETVSSLSMEQWKKFQKKWIDSLLFDYEMEGIRSQAPWSAEERFEVYESAFWQRFDSALSEDFPALKNKIEEEGLIAQDEYAWRGLIYECFQYEVPQSCAHSWTMNELGEVFLRNLKSMNHPHIAIAEKDWMKVKAKFYSLEPIPSTAEPDFMKVTQVSSEHLPYVKLVLHPSVQFLESEQTLFWYDAELRESSFSNEEWKALRQIKEGVPMLEIARNHPIFQMRVAELVQKGLIYGFQFN